MGWEDTEYIPVSALQHYVFCPRQCALIHLEQVWEENLFTLRGRRVHENVDIPDECVEEGVRIERAVPLWSERLGLIGRADVVEFLPDGTPYPVEYKAGPRRARRADEVQLCAQALCLEEMMGRPVTRGALYHHGSRRRREVRFTAELRSQVEEVVMKVRRLLQEASLPPPMADARCRDCSLVDACMPHALQNLPAWLEREWK
ncbi:CRISPR-associated protein Cas4 [Moorellaceae bacterium AZ2]